MDLRRLVIVATIALLGAAAFGQPGLAPGDPPLPEGVDAVWEQAVEAADTASTTPLPWTPDARPWAAALDAAEAAALAAPEHPAPQRLLTRVYATVGWWSRALVASDALYARRDADPWVDAEPPVPPGPPTTELVANAFQLFGQARMQAGDLEDASRVFERWMVAFPEDPDARRWLARARLDQGDPAGALPHLERWLHIAPGDPDAIFFLTEARLANEVGSEASFAFRDGASFYAAGDLAGAAVAFETARQAAPSFADAHAWAGRVALERGDPATAAAAFEAAARLRPDDGGYAYFLRVAQTQMAVGIEAGAAFFDALAAYGAGDVAGAAASFERAVAANVAFTEAWAWLGRTRQELGRLTGAAEAWARVVALDPGDVGAQGFLNLLRQQIAYGGSEGGALALAYATGVAAFERAEFDAAREAFARVVAADPDAGMAWAWLGRVAYTKRDFPAAAEAYARAARLLPDDADVAWFAEDAAWRAGGGDDADEVPEDAEDAGNAMSDADEAADEAADEMGGGP